MTVDTGTSVAITSAALTNDPTPVIEGLGEAGATIEVTVDGESVTTTVAPGGAWAVAIPTTLADGEHVVSVTATDPVGNSSTANQNLLVDTTTFVSITSPPLTNDATPTISGLGSPGDAVDVSAGGQMMTTIVAGDGAWSVEVPAVLADGPLTVSVTSTDDAGNVATATQELTVDTELAAVVTSPTVDNDETPRISGTGEPGAAVTVEIAGETLTTVVADDGTWSVDVGTPLPDGPHTGLVTVVDPAGNTTSFAHLIVVDTVAQLTSTDPGPVMDSTPTISGTGEPGSTVTVTVAGRIYTTTVADDGTWSAAITDALPDGEHPVVVRIEDPIGNVENETWTLVVDTVAELGTAAPVVSGDGDLRGSGEPGATVTVTIAGAISAVLVDADGTWSVPLPSGITAGSHPVTVTIRDLAGNTAEASHTVTISPGVLPTTGSSSAALAGAALLVSLVGGALVVGSSRRRAILVEC
ncbi:MAG: LPXTG cell wall anchor domain-containing protein [Ilumatobacter sp.]|nr:LPXTG cell wall anchor domain-containing protein [Ilumatobacter sp.]